LKDQFEQEKKKERARKEEVSSKPLDKEGIADAAKKLNDKWGGKPGNLF